RRWQHYRQSRSLLGSDRIRRVGLIKAILVYVVLRVEALRRGRRRRWPAVRDGAGERIPGGLRQLGWRTYAANSAGDEAEDPDHAETSEKRHRAPAAALAKRRPHDSPYAMRGSWRSSWLWRLFADDDDPRANRTARHAQGRF